MAGLYQSHTQQITVGRPLYRAIVISTMEIKPSVIQSITINEEDAAEQYVYT